MEIIIQNVTGSQNQAAKLLDSGVVIYDDGQISHILFEKQMNKQVFVRPEKKASETQSESRPVKKNKRKSAKEA